VEEAEPHVELADEHVSDLGKKFKKKLNKTPEPVTLVVPKKLLSCKHLRSQKKSHFWEFEIDAGSHKFYFIFKNMICIGIYLETILWTDHSRILGLD
jgi:hypothetical protein